MEMPPAQPACTERILLKGCNATFVLHTPKRRFDRILIIWYSGSCQSVSGSLKFLLVELAKSKISEYDMIMK